MENALWLPPHVRAAQRILRPRFRLDDLTRWFAGRSPMASIFPGQIRGSTAAAGPTTPPVTANLKLYFVADNGCFQDNGNSTPCTDSTTVQRWYDVNAGYGVNTNSGQRPTYLTNQLNGHPSIHFVAASNQYLDISGTGTRSFSSNNVTSYFVGKPGGSGSQGSMYGGTGGVAQYRIYLGNQATDPSGQAGLSSGNATVDTANYSQMNYKQETGQNMSYRYNSAADGTPSGLAGTWPFNYIGGGLNASNDMFNGYMCLILVYEASHDTTTRQSIESWITSVWGV